MVAHAFNANTCEAEAGGLYEFQVVRIYIYADPTTIH